MDDKEQMANEAIVATLKAKISRLEQFFAYFNLTENNFSKALLNDLNELCPKIKTSEKYFTALEKHKLIFINETEDRRAEAAAQKEQSELLLRILKRMNLELQSMEERLANDVNAQKVNYDKQHFDPLFSDLFKSCKEELSNLESRLPKVDIDEEKANSTIEACDEMKAQIRKLFEENCELNKKKEDLKLELKKYSSLPTDVNQIKTLIEIKKEELKALLNKKK